MLKNTIDFQEKNSSPCFKTFPRKCSKTGNRTCLLRIWNCFKRQGNDRTCVKIKILNLELKFRILESKCNHSGFKVERNIRRILVPILNRETVSDKARQWSDSGPVESIHFFLRASSLWEGFNWIFVQNYSTLSGPLCLPPPVKLLPPVLSLSVAVDNLPCFITTISTTKFRPFLGFRSR